MHGNEEKCMHSSVGKYEGNRWFERPRRRREILGIKQKGFEGKNQIHPALCRDN
jgi:hypothetical protein